MRTLEEVRQQLEWEVESADRALAKFAADVAKDAAYALRWSADAFREAARKTVYSVVLEASKREGVTVETLRATVLEQALRAARDVQNSTSRASNMYEDEARSAWASLVSGMGALLSVEKNEG